MDQHMLRTRRQPCQAAQDRLLTSATSFDPANRLGSGPWRRRSGDVCNGLTITDLTDDADPSNRLGLERRLKVQAGTGLSNNGNSSLLRSAPMRRPLPAAAISRCTSDSCGRQGDGPPYNQLAPFLCCWSMRLLALSPGSLQQQLERLPAIATAAEQLKATVQVACPLAHRQAWELVPAVEKVIPFNFDDGSTWRTGPTCWAACASLISRSASTSPADGK